MALLQAFYSTISSHHQILVQASDYTLQGASKDTAFYIVPFEDEGVNFSRLSTPGLYQSKFAVSYTISSLGHSIFAWTDVFAYKRPALLFVCSP